MTGTRNPQQDGSIQAMLRDSGLEDAVELRSTLEKLQTLVPDEAPVPRSDLAALLTAGVPAVTGAPAEAGAPADTDTGTTTASVPNLADRRNRKRRMALIGGAVVGAMSLGAGAVAASSQDFRENLGHTFTVIFKPGAPTPTPAPAPKPAGTAPTDIPAAQWPVPVETSPARTAPAPAAAAPGAAVPAPPSPVATVPAPQHPAPALTPPAVGRDGVLPTPDKRPAVPGFQGKNGRGIPVSPLPTVPGVPEVPSTVPGS
ncbi:hypothetical protein [Arthrobacter sp. B3I4]|uniref:hypothetical protein n=1 Tax=Arthrobacter sp. B3I4 TaxID=3042267 RepID=UPI002788E1C6|nr:hypothetical protein [Arthrobacter sp. B3I4]MDQ0754391.1 hypothetical protein [Arthrobacter sp. B3I4]